MANGSEAKCSPTCRDLNPPASQSALEHEIPAWAEQLGPACGCPLATSSEWGERELWGALAAGLLRGAARHRWLARSGHAEREAHLHLEVCACAGQTYSCLDAGQASRSYFFRAYLTSGWRQRTSCSGQSWR